MATILVDFNSENWGDQDWLRRCLWSEGKRTHEAIFRAIFNTRSKTWQKKLNLLEIF